MVFFTERALRRAVQEYAEHYHGERNHQGMGSKLTKPGSEAGRADGQGKCRERPGGLLRYCYREAR